MTSRNRGSVSSRSPGLVDSNAARANRFYNSSLRFDSTTSEEVTGPALSAVGTFTKEISIAIWHKWTGAKPVNYSSICSCAVDQGLDEGWCVYWYDDPPAASFFVGDFNRRAEAAATYGDWNLIVAVYDGNLGSANIKTYVNGSVGSTTYNHTADINLTGDPEVRVGIFANSYPGEEARFTVGNCDEFAIWDSALSAAEVTEIYNDGVAGFAYNVNSGLYESSSNLRLWWRLGDGDDTDGADGIVDMSGNANHGTLTDITSANFEIDVAGGGV